MFGCFFSVHVITKTCLGTTRLSLLSMEPSASIDQKANCQRHVLQLTSMLPCSYDRIRTTVFFIVQCVCLGMNGCVCFCIPERASLQCVRWIYRWSAVHFFVVVAYPDLLIFVLLFQFVSNRKSYCARNCSGFRCPNFSSCKATS